MGVRSYVAGMKSDSVQNATNIGWGALGLGANEHEKRKALEQAKAKTDINREYQGAQSAVDQFINELQYDRDYQNYTQRVEEKFSDIAATIHDNQLLSDSARRELMETYLPQLKGEALSKVSILSTNAQMAEIEVEIEGYGDTVASDHNKSLDVAISEYRSHISDLELFNDVTVDRMVQDFAYSTAPLKALQSLQGEYQEKYLDRNFSLESRVDQISGEFELDTAQRRALSESLAEFQTNFDKQVDSRFAEEKNILLGNIAEARDADQLFDLDSIDAMMNQVPTRHKLELYKAKNTAMSNNDEVLYQQIRKVVDEGHVFSSQDWELIALFNDPKKRDETAESMLLNQGKSLIASGQTLADALATIENHDGPISQKNRTEAKARLLKVHLDHGSDVSKIAKEMLGSSGHTPIGAGSIPEQEYVEIVESVIQEAPALDDTELSSRGQQYIWEHEREIADFLANSPAFKLPKAEMTFKVDGKFSTAETPESSSAQMVSKATDNSVKPPSINLPNASLTFDPSSEETDSTEPETDPIIQEIAQEIVARQIEEAMVDDEVNDDTKTDRLTEEAVALLRKKKESSSEIVDMDEPERNPESPWLSDYQTAVAQRRAELRHERELYDQRLEEQAQYVQQIAGTQTEPIETGSQRVELAPGMSQIELVTHALQIIKDGEGRYLTRSELSLVKDDALRQELITMASIRDSLTEDTPLSLDYIDQLRRNPTVSEQQLKTVIRDFVDRGFIKAETGDELTRKYSFAETDQRSVLNSIIGEAVSAVYPAGKGEYFGTKRTYLRQRVSEAVDQAIAMNPDLLGKDFALLQKQIETFVAGEASRRILGDMEKVARLVSTENLSRRIDNLEHSDVSTFLQDVNEGRYDLLINYDLVQQPQMRSSRHDSKEVLLDKVTQEMSPYRNFSDLVDNGTLFERFRVLANSNFILAGGVLEKALTGSFGIQPSDMKIAGKQWAYADPEADGLYFIATDTDVQKRGTLGWGMATGDYDGTKGFIMFRDYVDPKLAYEIEDIQRQINDPLFERKKTAADQNRNQLPLGTGGLGYSPVQIQEQLDDRYYGVIEDYESKMKELEELTHDIMTYRHNLLGSRAGSLPKRL